MQSSDKGAHFCLSGNRFKRGEQSPPQQLPIKLKESEKNILLWVSTTTTTITTTLSIDYREWEEGWIDHRSKEGNDKQTHRQNDKQAKIRKRKNGKSFLPSNIPEKVWRADHGDHGFEISPSSGVMMRMMIPMVLFQVEAIPSIERGNFVQFFKQSVQVHFTGFQPGWKGAKSNNEKERKIKIRPLPLAYSLWWQKAELLTIFCFKFKIKVKSSWTCSLQK